VRRTGGLRDTVKDIDEENGYGLCCNHASLTDIDISIQRAIELYADKKKMKQIRKTMMEIDNSWTTSAQQYLNLYNEAKK
jgi:starch synthase